MKKQLIKYSLLSMSLGLVTALILNFTNFETVIEASEEEDVQIIEKIKVHDKPEKFNKLEDKVKVNEKPMKQLENKYVPFDVEDVLVQSIEIGIDNNRNEIIYIGKKGETLILSATDQKFSIVTDKYDLVDVKFSDGKSATFLDNTVVQHLFWEEDGLFYTLEAYNGNKKVGTEETKKIKPYNPSKLVKIAESLK